MRLPTWIYLNPAVLTRNRGSTFGPKDDHCSKVYPGAFMSYFGGNYGGSSFRETIKSPDNNWYGSVFK